VTRGQDDLLRLIKDLSDLADRRVSRVFTRPALPLQVLPRVAARVQPTLWAGDDEAKIDAIRQAFVLAIEDVPDISSRSARICHPEAARIMYVLELSELDGPLLNKARESIWSSSEWDLIHQYLSLKAELPKDGSNFRRFKEDVRGSLARSLLRLEEKENATVDEGWAAGPSPQERADHVGSDDGAAESPNEEWQVRAFAIAAEQLGSERPAARVAALYSLERVAQGSPAHRQAVVDVICGYLRMPFDPTKIDSESSEERELRLTAQRILCEHVRDDRPFSERAGSAIPPGFWAEISIDLRGAGLKDFDFTQCHVRRAIFDSCIFMGKANFSKAEFEAVASFEEAKFEGDARFIHCLFGGRKATFRRATFNSSATFNLTTFEGDAFFDDCQFVMGASFGQAKFTGSRARFRRAAFGGNANFHQVNFAVDQIIFDSVRFEGLINFEHADLLPETTFTTTRFEKAKVRGRSRDHKLPANWAIRKQGRNFVMVRQGSQPLLFPSDALEDFIEDSLWDQNGRLHIPFDQ
jgi:uncharacterized protein YjbI with pentapeptide repeats